MRQVDKWDPFINNFFEYELGIAEPVIRDRYRSVCLYSDIDTRFDGFMVVIKIDYFHD